MQIWILLSLPRTTVTTITKKFHNSGKQTGMERGSHRRSKLLIEQKEFINLKIDERSNNNIKMPCPKSIY